MLKDEGDAKNSYASNAQGQFQAGVSSADWGGTTVRKVSTASSISLLKKARYKPGIDTKSVKLNVP